LAGLVSAYIQHFTYAGLLAVLILCGMGLPIPEDVALLAGGFLVHRGVIQYPMTLACWSAYRRRQLAVFSRAALAPGW
jgi:membrane protein DedA with SNARE-associated domain